MSGELRFDGDVVIVTGGAGGIGRSQAVELGRRGARVVVNDLGGAADGTGNDDTAAAEVAAEISARGGTALASWRCCQPVASMRFASTVTKPLSSSITASLMVCCWFKSSRFYALAATALQAKSLRSQDFHS